VRDFNGIYETNWHAKVPALHRWEPFARALESLAALGNISEHDFMRAMHAQHAKIGILDGGIWWIHSGFATVKDANSQMISSYTAPAVLAKHGYRMTRVDCIPSKLPQVTVRKEWRS